MLVLSEAVLVIAIDGFEHDARTVRKLDLWSDRLRPLTGSSGTMMKPDGLPDLTPKAVTDFPTVPLRLRNHLRGWSLVLSGNPRVLQTLGWGSQALQA